MTCFFCKAALSNVYVVIYATINGKTGHAGIAVDNYRIQQTGENIDTVTDGTLTYYDLWPEKDDFRLFHLSKNRKARFYKLPNAIWPEAVTINSLYDNGIPHREYYPCDGLLMFRTNYFSDESLRMFLDSVIGSERSFNPRFYNCSDFVQQAIRFITGKQINAKEFLPFGFSTTPNKLCKKLMKLHDVVVVKDPGNKIKGSFLNERVLKRKPPPSLLAFNQ